MQKFTQEYINRGISQSALSLFRDCPYAFKLRYFDKEEAVFFDPTILDVGKYVHDAIDMYYKHHYESHQTAEEVLYYSYSELKKIWDTFLLPEHLLKAFECLSNHAKWEYEQRKVGISVQPFSEVEISYGGYFGLIDYVDLTKKNVIDWKTGKKAYLSYEYRMQAHIYKTLFEGKFGTSLDKFFFFFLYPNEFRMVSYQTSSQKKVGLETEKLKEQLIEALDNGCFEQQPRTDSKCRYCNYNFYCKGECFDKEW